MGRLPKPPRTLIRAIALLLVARAALFGGEVANPAALLEREKGLTRQPNGTVWICRHERRLREQFNGLDEARASLVRLQNQLDERVKRNALLWANGREQIGLLQQTQAALKPDDPKRRQLDRQIEQLRSQAVEPQLLGGEAEVRARLIELLNVRSRLLLSLLTIRKTMAGLEAEYQRLAEDPEVLAALRQLGTQHRLGPLNTNYRGEMPRLEASERVVFTDAWPLFLQGGAVRIGALLNETTPLLLTWQPTSDPLVLPAGVAEAAGLEVPPDAPTVVLDFPHGRRLPTRTVEVPALRFGKHVLQQVSAQILPPEGEDLGARIGPLAFAQFRVSVEPERLRFVVQAK